MSEMTAATLSTGSGTRVGSSVGRTAGRTGLVFGGNLLGTALGFLSNLLIMRALGASGFGVILVTTTVLNVFWQLTGRGIDQALVRCMALQEETHPDPQHETADTADGGVHAFSATAHQIKLVLGTAVALVGIGLSWPLTWFFISPQASVVPMMVAALSAPVASAWGYTGSVLQATGRFREYTVVLVANAAVRFAIVAVLCGTQQMTVTLAVASLGLGYLGGAAVGYALCPAQARRWRGRPNLRPVLYSLSVWLTISSVIHLLYSRLDQLILSRMAGSHATGVYGAAATFVQMVDLLTASLLTVLLPRICRETEPGPLRRQAWASIRTSSILIVPLLSGFVLADPIIGRLLGSSYGQTALIFKIILAGALFNVLTHPLQAILHARGRTDRLLWLDVGLLLLSGLANFVAIKNYGVIGAAWACVFLRVSGGILLLVLVLRELRPEHGDSADRRSSSPLPCFQPAREGDRA